MNLTNTAPEPPPQTQRSTPPHSPQTAASCPDSPSPPRLRSTCPQVLAQAAVRVLVMDHDHRTGSTAGVLLSAGSAFSAISARTGKEAGPRIGSGLTNFDSWVPRFRRQPAHAEYVARHALSPRAMGRSLPPARRGHLRPSGRHRRASDWPHAGRLCQTGAPGGVPLNAPYMISPYHRPDCRPHLVVGRGN